MIDSPPAAPSDQFNIREFSYPQDYAAVINLWSTVGPGVHVGRSDTPEEIEKKLQRDPQLFLVAEHSGEIIGAVLGGFDGRRGIVYHLAVSPRFQEQGIGSALMDAVETRLRELGCIRVYLLVTQDNPANAYYQRRGWDKMDLNVYGKNI